MTHKESKTRLRQLRVKEHSSIEDVANAIGVSTSSIGNLEHNRGRVSVPTAQRIADYFGTPLDELFVIETIVKIRGIQPALPE